MVGVECIYKKILNQRICHKINEIRDNVYWIKLEEKWQIPDYFTNLENRQSQNNNSADQWQTLYKKRANFPRRLEIKLRNAY